MSTAPSFPPDLWRSPFHAEEFVAAQFLPSRSLTGFQRLAFGLIEDMFLAKRFALRHASNLKSQCQCERDVEWINGAPAPILFQDLCDALGISADRVRQRYFALTRGQKVPHKVSTFA